MDQIVTCGGVDCSVCFLLESASILFKWLLGTSFAVSALIVVLGGLAYIFDLGKKNYIYQAKRILHFATAGFVAVLISFIAVQTVIWAIGGKIQGSWWQFNCTVDESAVFSNNTGSSERAKKVPVLTNEKEDAKPIIENTYNLSDLQIKNAKIATLDVKNLNPLNLRQDLLSLNTGEEIRFLAGAKDVKPEEIAAFTKLLNGFVDNGENGYNVDELTKKFQDVVTVRKDDGDLTITSSNDLTNAYGSYWSGDPVIEKKLDTIISFLGNQTSQKIIAFKNARSEGSLNLCLDSGGDWREFPNECTARKEVYGKEKIRCSAISNPTLGCDCPGNYTLSSDGVCVKKEAPPKDSAGLPENTQNIIEKASDDFLDNYYNQTDLCAGVFLQERLCPATRCDNNGNITVYPPSGKDQCAGGAIKTYSCEPLFAPHSDPSCAAIKDVSSSTELEKRAAENQTITKTLNDLINRSNPNNNPDNWGNNNNNSTATNKGNGQGGSGNTGGTGNTSGTGKTGDAGKTGDSSTTSDSGKTGSDTSDKSRTGDTPSTSAEADSASAQRAQSFNPTPEYTELAECIGFKDGKVPKNGVIVELENEDDPTNANNPTRNVGRLFYLDPYGNIIGNAGDKNSGGLKSGAWTKGSGGTAWSTWSQENGEKVYKPEWITFDAQTTHNSDPNSFRSGAGDRVGPEGEKIDADGKIDPEGGKVQNMSGCNMHSGSKRSHSRGCKTMGGQERKGFTDYVKKTATQDGGQIIMATLPVKNTDQNSQRIQSDWCGKMNPYKAIDQFKGKSKYKNWNPF